jgi:hypothetical protein
MGTDKHGSSARKMAFGFGEGHKLTIIQCRLIELPLSHEMVG